MPIPRYHIVFRHSIPNPTDSAKALPESLFQGLLSLPASPPSNLKGLKIENDWRHGQIHIDWIDISPMALSGDSYKEKTPRRGVSNPVASFLSKRNVKMGTVALPEGVVHIFRDSPLPGASSSSNSETVLVDDMSTATGVVLAILSVPSYMTSSDFLTFVAPAADGILHLRIIRDSSPNRSIVLINFKDQNHATEFAEDFNGKEFNSMQPEICQVVQVTSVKIEAHDEYSLVNARLSSGGDNVHELPTCPVCLERMDASVTGLVTIPCSHTFHCSCLTKWGDSRCPVCRYSQSLLSSHRSKPSIGSRSASLEAPPPPSLTTCWDCSSTMNLWICLICGNVGCGRYGRAHAQSHYQSTTHLYALELETQRVWDYAGDGYVHRLIQNKADGKLVELPSASSFSAGSNDDSSRNLGPTASDNLTAEKIEAIGIEYSYLLTSQLDSQREYFEQKTSKLQSRLQEAEAQAVDSLNITRRAQNEASEQEAKERKRVELRAEKAAELARKFEKELKEERAVSKGLLQNLSSLKSRLERAESEKSESASRMADLEEQVRDLMFFLEAKEKISQGGEGLEDAAGGRIEIRSPPQTKQTSKGRRKG